MRTLLLILGAGLLLSACARDDTTSPDLRTRTEAFAADVRSGDLRSCEAAARLYDLPLGVAGIPPDGVLPFLADRSAVLAGLAPSLIGGSDGSEVQGFTDSGFRLEFRDGSNQVRHLAAAIQAGASLGPSAALLHRALRPDTPQDEALNDAGTRLGANLRSGAVVIKDAGDWIRDNICE